jgi:ubiquinone/menaquinone biosynthesis C-methylase UbiE
MEHKKLLHELVCPDCKESLIFGRNVLKCSNCKREYLIKEDIPLFYNPEIAKSNSGKEYAYWSEKNHTPENLYENMMDSAFQKLLNLFHIPDNTRGLELGAGDGPFARRLKHKNLEIYGLDISLPLLKLTENMLPVQGNALKLPFRNNFFDWIIYAFALHHMPNPRKALQEAIRVLGENAKIFIVDPNYYHPMRFLTSKPETFLRRYVFKYLSPEERWIPLYRVKNILKENNIVIQHVSFLTPEFRTSSLIGNIQKIGSTLLNFPPFRMFVHSYYVIIGTKDKEKNHHLLLSK